MAVPAIRIQRLTKLRGQRVLLSELDLSVSAGEHTALIGANGAGKTTLIKCLLDLDTVTSGDISIFGRKHNRSGARAHLAYLPENFRPPGHLTGREYLSYMSRLYGNDSDPDRVKSILEILDLDTPDLEKLTVDLSRGTAQKLGLAACLLSGKKLLVMDEPMSGLDPGARMNLKHHLLQLKRRGCTLFFTTHLLADMENLCDSIAILHRGEIRYTGSPSACCRYFKASDLEQAWYRCVGGSGPEPMNG